MNKQLIDYFVWYGCKRTFAVARFPEIPHWLQHLTAAEPLVKLGVDGHCEIGGDQTFGRLANKISVLARADKNSCDNLALAWV